jgi:hypothetical protein
MHRGPQGEPIARSGGGRTNGVRRRRNLTKAARSAGPQGPVRAGEPVIDRDSRASAWRRLALPSSAKRAGGGRPDEGRFKISGGGLGKDKAQGSIWSSHRLTVCAAAKDSGKGQSPETAARRSGPRIRPREQRREKRCVGSSLADKAFDTLREEQDSEGSKPQERCRDETSPDRPRRAQTVKRVAKP